MSSGSPLTQPGSVSDAFRNVLGGGGRNDSDDVSILIAQEKELAVGDCWFDRMHDCSTATKRGVTSSSMTRNFTNSSVSTLVGKCVNPEFRELNETFASYGPLACR